MVGLQSFMPNSTTNEVHLMLHLSCGCDNNIIEMEECYALLKLRIGYIQLLSNEPCLNDLNVRKMFFKIKKMSKSIDLLLIGLALR